MISANTNSYTTQDFQNAGVAVNHPIPASGISVQEVLRTRFGNFDASTTIVTLNRGAGTASQQLWRNHPGGASKLTPIPADMMVQAGDVISTSAAAPKSAR